MNFQTFCNNTPVTRTIIILQIQNIFKASWKKNSTESASSFETDADAIKFVHKV